MKNLLKALIICLTIFMTSSISYAIPDYGSHDTLMFKTALSNNSEESETKFVSDSLTETFIMGNRYEGEWVKVSDGVFAHYLDADTEYFLVKTGNIKTGYTDFLFLNETKAEWAVVNMSDLGIPEKDLNNIGKFSHLSEFTSTSTPVPEPSTMILFGGGLLGLCGILKKSYK